MRVRRFWAFFQPGQDSFYAFFCRAGPAAIAGLSLVGRRATGLSLVEAADRRFWQSRTEQQQGRTTGILRV